MFAKAGGTSVVLPVPGGACTTMFPVLGRLSMGFGNGQTRADACEIEHLLQPEAFHWAFEIFALEVVSIELAHHAAGRA